MEHAGRVIFVLSLLFVAGQVATSLAADVTVVSSFPADNGPGYKVVPDTQGAVGPNHVVDFDGLNFVIHDKKTGTVLLKKSQREFWASVESANALIAPNPWDPRFLFDNTSGRWIGVIASDGHGLGYLAVSTSSDPTKAWKGVLLPMGKQDLGFKLGVDKNGLYATYASAEPDRDLHTLHDCIAIPKEDLIAPEGPSLKNLVTFTKLEHASFPATDLNPDKAPSDPEVILNKEFGDDCGKLYMYKIVWKGKAASISDKQIVSLSKKISIAEYDGGGSDRPTTRSGNHHQSTAPYNQRRSVWRQCLSMQQREIE